MSADFSGVSLPKKQTKQKQLSHRMQRCLRITAQRSRLAQPQTVGTTSAAWRGVACRCAGALPRSPLLLVRPQTSWPRPTPLSSPPLTAPPRRPHPLPVDTVPPRLTVTSRYKETIKRRQSEPTYTLGAALAFSGLYEYILGLRSQAAISPYKVFPLSRSLSSLLGASCLSW